MRFLFCSLIISISLIKPLPAADISTAPASSEDNISEKTVLESLQRQQYELQLKLEMLEKELDKKDTELSNLNTSYHELQKKYTELLQQDAAAAKPASKDDTNPSAANILENAAVMDYLDEYYLDVSVQPQQDKSPEEKKPEEEVKKLSDKAEMIKENGQTKIVIEQRLTGDDEKIKEIVRYVDKSISEDDSFKPASETDKKEQKELSRAQKELFKAQRLFYANNFDSALRAVDRSIDNYETAIAYALEGSIYLTIGDRISAIGSWKKALELDPDMYEVKEALYRYDR